MLLFLNRTTNIIEAFSITTNSLKHIYKLGIGTSLLGKYKTDRQTQNIQILDATGTNIETMKVLFVLNNLKDVLKKL